jgi:hypothetical protein
MVPEPYDSSHIAIALASLALSLGLLPVLKQRFMRVSVLSLPGRLLAQCRSDLARRNQWTIYWCELCTLALLVSVLHFGGRSAGLYIQYPWWDLLTHSMSGAGVAGILLVGLRNATPTELSLSWVIVALLAIGAGFEVYEYVFKSFWHPWSLSVYAHDTVVDLVMGCLGGALGFGQYRLRTLVVRTPAVRQQAQPND